MEQLKKNLHFAVFGAGVFLGIVFVGLGIFIRSGTEAEIETAKKNLASQAGVQTQGTFDEATSRSERFGKSMAEAESALNDNPGTKFTQSFDQHQDGRQFYTNEGNLKFQRIKARFAAMESKLALPAVLAGWEFGSGSSREENIWEGLETEITNPPDQEKILEMQRRLRALEEIATTIEKLLETGAGDNLGVKLLELKFPSPWGPAGNSESESPWLGLPIEFVLQCSPGFAVLLADELSNPTQRTLTETAPSEPGKAGNKRIGFPILVEQAQTVMVGRQSEMKVRLNNEDKQGALAAVNKALPQGQPEIKISGEAKDLDPETDQGKRVIDAVAANLNEHDRLRLPVHAGFKIKPLSFNKNWRAVKAPEENQ